MRLIQGSICALTAAAITSGCCDGSGFGFADTVMLEDAQNGFYAASYTTTPISVQDCPEDLTIDWSGVSVDLLGQPVDPTVDIEIMRMVAYHDLNVEGVMEAIATGTLAQSHISGNLDHEVTPGETSAPISEFHFNGTRAEPAASYCAAHGETYQVAVMTDLYDYATFAFFVPTEGETNTTVALDPTTTSLEIEVDLASGGVAMPAGTPRITLDWSALTEDMRGDEFPSGSIEQVSIGRFDLDATQLEDSFLELEDLAVELYSAPTWSIQTELALNEAVDADGESFPGFDHEGVWLVGLLCTSCGASPPIFLAVVELE